MGLQTSRYWVAAATGALTWALAAIASVVLVIVFVGGGSGSNRNGQSNIPVARGAASDASGGAAQSDPVTSAPKTNAAATGVSPTQTVRNVLAYRFKAFKDGDVSLLANYYSTRTGTLWDNDEKLIRGGKFTGSTLTAQIKNVEASTSKITADVAVTVAPASGQKEVGEFEPYIFVKLDNGQGLRWYDMK